MNIFYTHSNPFLCAKDHCKVLQVKMILEYAQLLCTSIRVLDGKKCKVYKRTVKKIKLEDGSFIRKVSVKLIDWYEMPSDTFFYRFGMRFIKDHVLYKHTHVNHPSAIWTRQTTSNYMYVYALFSALCTLFEQRTGKTHATARLIPLLKLPPVNMPVGALTPILLAMPDEYKQQNKEQAYKDYLNDKYLDWLTREKPVDVSFPCGIPSWVSNDIKQMIEV
jgi:hypothetical protein